MQGILHRKIFTIGVTVLSILGYGFLVFAAAPMGGYTPGSGLNGTLDPTCTPGSSDCFVNVGWKLDPTNSYVYNTTDMIGIGTATPTRSLDVLGNVLITTDHTGLVASELQSLNSITTSVTPDATVNGSEYYGTKTTLTFDPTSTGNDLTYTGSPTAGGIYENLASQVSTLEIQGTGDVARSTSLRNSVTASGTGTYGRIYTLDNLLALTGAGTIANAQGINNVLYGTAGTIDLAQGGATSIDGDPLATSTSHITTGIGNFIGIKNITTAIGTNISIVNATDSGDGFLIRPNIANAPFTDGIQATTNAYGFHIDSLGSITKTGIRSANTYGLYISAGSLIGTTSEYGLYVADAEAANFLVNGVRIGTDSDNNKISSSTSGASSTTLYIGTNTIDTTAPSDERTKNDIVNTSYGLDTLNNIRVVDFKYNQSIIGDNNKQHTGVLAQQVLPLYPEAVGQRSDGYMMVDYKTFIPLIIKSVQDLNLKMSTINTISEATLTDSFKNQIISWFGDITNNISLIIADTFKARTQICIDDVCIDKSQLQQIITNNPSNPPLTIDNPPSDTDPAPTDDPNPSDTPTDSPTDTPTDSPL